MKIGFHRQTSTENQLPSPKANIIHLNVLCNEFQKEGMNKATHTRQNWQELYRRKLKTNFLHLLLLLLFAKFLYNIRTLYPFRIHSCNSTLNFNTAKYCNFATKFNISELCWIL